jgi:hypothetical protein
MVPTSPQVKLIPSYSLTSCAKQVLVAYLDKLSEELNIDIEIQKLYSFSAQKNLLYIPFKYGWGRTWARDVQKAFFLRMPVHPDEEENYYLYKGKSHRKLFTRGGFVLCNPNIGWMRFAQELSDKAKRRV